MKNTILTVVAVLALIFPFATIAVELARRESMMTLLVFGAIALFLAVTVILAMLTSRPKQS